MKGEPAFSLVLALPTNVGRDKAEELYEELENFLANGCGVMPVLSVSGVVVRTKHRRKLAPLDKARAAPIPNENQQSLL